MRHCLWRHIASIVLLATYLPMVVLSSLHVHNETIHTDDNCLQCAGHFESSHHHERDCLYCHFLSLSYLGETEEPPTSVPQVSDSSPATITDAPVMPHFGTALLRAPPTA